MAIFGNKIQNQFGRDNIGNRIKKGNLDKIYSFKVRGDLIGNYGVSRGNDFIIESNQGNGLLQKHSLKTENHNQIGIKI